MKKILEEYPAIRPVIYVIKYYLRQRKLNESYTGGVSSFLLFNLFIAYIYYLGKSTKIERKNLGEIMVGFFQFYAFEFNYEEVGISLRHGGFFYKKSERFW